VAVDGQREVVRVREAVTSPLSIVAVLTGVAVAVFAAVAVGVPLAARALTVVAAVAGVCLVVRRKLRRFVVVSEKGLVVRRANQQHQVDWSMMAAVEIRRAAGPNQLPHVSVRVLPRSGGRSVPSIPALPVWAGDVVHDAAMRAGVAINPEPPWRDRFGQWHGVPGGREPRESIRSVHEAFVGPWRIRIRRVDAEYQAVAEGIRGNVRLVSAPMRATLQAARDDGSRLVDDAISALDAGLGHPGPIKHEPDAPT
jgi:hypothetical protein